MEIGGYLMSQIRLQTFSYRFAEQVLNSRLNLKHEIESILLDTSIDLAQLSRPKFNIILDDLFGAKGWESQPPVFEVQGDPSAKMDFLKDRIGIEVGFGQPSFLGIDLLKFQVSSYSGLDKIDVGVHIVTTKNFQIVQIEQYGNKWRGTINYERVVRYLPHFKSAIQVPIYVIGLDL